MKIPGATIAPPTPRPSEPVAETGLRGSAYAEDRASVASAQRPIEAQQPVDDVERAPVIYLRQHDPLAALPASVDHYAEHAVATYESVQQLKRRDDLRAFAGVDDFA